MLFSSQAGTPSNVPATRQRGAPHAIEEAYEVADAIARGDLVDLGEELGETNTTPTVIFFQVSICNMGSLPFR